MAENDIPIDEWLADNYDAVVADKNRGIGYADLAETFEARNSPDLAAWARSRAAGRKADVTPTEARSEPVKSKRDK